MWPFSRVERKLDLVQQQQAAIVRSLRKLQIDLDALRVSLTARGRNIMHKIDEVIDRLQAQSTVIDGLTEYNKHLRDQIEQALSGANIPADVQAKIDQAFDLAEQNTGRIASAMVTKDDGSTPAPVGDQGGSTADTGAASTDQPAQAPTVDASTGQPVDDGPNAA